MFSAWLSREDFLGDAVCFYICSLLLTVTTDDLGRGSFAYAAQQNKTSAELNVLAEHFTLDEQLCNPTGWALHGSRSDCKLPTKL